MNKVVRYIVSYVSGVLLLLPFWIFGTFGSDVTVEQIVFHLLSGIVGIEGADSSLKTSFMLHNLAAPLLFPLLMAAISMLAGKFTGNEGVPTREKVLNLLCLALFVTSASLFTYKFHLIKYLKSRFGEDIFSGLYADPSKIHYKVPAHKKNMVLIYVESLESDLSNLRPDGINAIKPIDDLPGFQVKDFRQAPGTGWSIAGMIASQAGVPVKPFYYKESGDFVGSMTKKAYFPNLVTLSDILARYGYVQYFLTGPQIRFAGMDKFYFGHQYNYAFGRDEWLAKGLDKELFTSWGDGLQDDTLLDQAYSIITENRAKKKPFVLAMITTDTHFPDGFPSPKCNTKDAHSSFIGAFRYTSSYLAGMVGKLISEGVLEDTDIIIMGDHLFMASDEQIRDYFAKERRIYFKMISAESRKPARDTMTHFDVAPTILDLLGMRINPDEHFGLGISLFSGISPTEYERHLKQIMSDEILSPSVVYDSFWSSK